MCISQNSRLGKLVKLVNILRFEIIYTRFSLFSARPHTLPKHRAMLCILIKGESSHNGKDGLQAAIKIIKLHSVGFTSYLRK